MYAYLEINGKATRDYNVGLTLLSKVMTTSQRTANHCFWPLPCCLIRSRRNTREYPPPKTLYWRKLEPLSYISAAVIWICLHSYSQCGWFRKTHVMHYTVAVEGHPRSYIDFGSILLRMWTSYLVVNCNRGSYIHRFGETATSWPEIATFLDPISLNLSANLGFLITASWKETMLRRLW